VLSEHRVFELITFFETSHRTASEILTSDTLSMLRPIKLCHYTFKISQRTQLQYLKLPLLPILRAFLLRVYNLFIDDASGLEARKQ
jgi:hypothetical protein